MNMELYPISKAKIKIVGLRGHVYTDLNGIVDGNMSFKYESEEIVILQLDAPGDISTMFNDLVYGWKIFRVLRRLAKQRVALVLQPGNV